jgi:hypothetical protein
MLETCAKSGLFVHRSSGKRKQKKGRNHPVRSAPGVRMHPGLVAMTKKSLTPLAFPFTLRRRKQIREKI